MKRITILKRAKIDLEEISRVYHNNRHFLLYDDPKSFVIETDNEDEGCLELVTPIDSLEAFKEMILDVFKKYEWSDFVSNTEYVDEDYFEYQFEEMSYGIDGLRKYYLMFQVNENEIEVTTDGYDTGKRTINLYELRDNLKEIERGLCGVEDALKQIENEIEKEKLNK